MTTSDLAGYQQAELERAIREGRRQLVVHARIFGGVMTGLVAVNVILVATTTARFWWFPFPLVGWGIGLGNRYRGVRRLEGDVRVRQSEIERAAIAARRVSA